MRDAVEREAQRSGIEVRYVDPAWTSRLGNLKYRRRCRVGIHHAAALVIGRRGLGFGERLPEGHPFLTRTVECVSTTGASRTFVQGSLRSGFRVVAVAPDAGPAHPVRPVQELPACAPMGPRHAMEVWLPLAGQGARELTCAQLATV